MGYTTDDIDGLPYVHVFGRIHSLAWYEEWCNLVRFLDDKKRLLSNEMVDALICQEYARAKN